MTAGMGAPPLYELAASFDVECGATATGIIRDLIPEYGAAWANGLLGRLHLVRTRLGADRATVTFGGHFSSGKSTVINALIGRPLLPTSDYPETGVPCTVTVGKADHAMVVRCDGTEVLGVHADAIAHVVSLIDGAGSYRDGLGAVSRVDITLGSGLLPAGVSFIDSPGINDTATMTERAAATAADADVIMWVVNSRQALSETEQAFLDEHAATGCVILVVNAFLTEDTSERWSWFLRERAPLARTRIMDALGDRPGGCPPVMFMSARGAISAPLAFGAAEVRDWVATLHQDETLLMRARLTRAAADLGVLGCEVQALIDREQRRHAIASSKLKKRAEDAVQRRNDFKKAVRRRITAAFNHYEATAEKLVSKAVSEIGTGELQRDGIYGRDLTRRLRAVCGQLANQMLDDASTIAREYELPALSAETAQKVKRLLAPAAVEITVPDSPAVKTSKGGLGAVLGSIICSFIAPVPGTLTGAAVRGALGSGRGDNGITAAVTKDREGAQANARAAGAAALSELAAKQDTVRRLLFEDPCLGEPSAPIISTVTLDAVMTLGALLRDQRNEWLRLLAAPA